MAVRKSQFTAPAALSGMTLDLWRKDPNRVAWARSEPKFREAIAILLNQRIDTLCAQSRNGDESFGIVKGYDHARLVLTLMAEVESKSAPAPEQNYPAPETSKESYT